MATLVPEEEAGNQLGQPLSIRGRGRDDVDAVSERLEHAQLGVEEDDAPSQQVAGEGSIGDYPQDARQGEVGDDVCMDAHVMEVGEWVGVDACAQGCQACAQGLAL